jgi:pimeloyl-ACP methyl ester carboxylesterase
MKKISAQVSPKGDTAKQVSPKGDTAKQVSPKGDTAKQDAPKSSPSVIAASDLHGLAKLLVHSTTAITDIAEDLHQRIAEPGTRNKGRTSGITGLVYRSVRGVTRLVGVGVTGVIRLLAAEEIFELPPAVGRARENLISILNGVVGDHLAQSENPLAIQMQLRTAPGVVAKTLQCENADVKIALFVHGLCLNEHQWRCDAHVQAALDLDCKPLFLKYNSGLPVADNGAELSALLETYIANSKLAEIVVIAHSMGGLVIRAALYTAQQNAQTWPGRVSKIIFLGTPHMGAPLERSGNWIHSLWQATPYAGALAPIAKIRSAGITDLRHGQIRSITGYGKPALAADGANNVPLPLGIQCYAIAAALTKTPGEFSDDLLGDGLVPIPSALGIHANPEFSLVFAKSRSKILRGMGHMELLHAPEATAQIRKWLR